MMMLLGATDYRQVSELRQGLESQAVLLASERINPAQLSELEDIVWQLRDEDDLERSTILDKRLHLSLIHIFTSGVYLFIGWMALFMLPSLLRNMPPLGLFWLVLGGALYTVGGVLYAVKWPGRNNPRFGCHEIFHVFILLGSAAHFFLMYQVVALR